MSEYNHEESTSVRITSTKDPLRILLIEDSKGDALLIEKALNAAMPEGYSIQKAVTLEEALKLLPDHSFDVALLDRSLPDVEGFDGLHSLQNIAPQLPIVLLTAYKDEQTALEAIEQGAQDYLYKDKIDGHIIKRALQYAVLRKEFEGVLIMRANFDNLTGLANRMLFESRLDMALAKMKRHSGEVAVLFLDLDRFKPVNDTYGHAAGDKLLKEVGGRLKGALRAYDTASRFGGDEFAILLEGLPKAQHAEIVAKKIIQLLDAPTNVFGNEVTVGVSIGIAACASGQEISAETLMQQADAAMYEAKTVNGSSHCTYVGGRSDLAKIAAKQA